MEKTVLCVASYYNHKIFFNDDEFVALPTDVKTETKKIVAEVAETVKGIVSVGFYENGNVYIEVGSDENDVDFDEIGAQYHLGKMKKKNIKFFNALTLWYKVTKLGAKGIAIK